MANLTGTPFGRHQARLEEMQARVKAKLDEVTQQCVNAPSDGSVDLVKLALDKAKFEGAMTMIHWAVGAHIADFPHCRPDNELDANLFG